MINVIRVLILLGVVVNLQACEEIDTLEIVAGPHTLICGGAAAQYAVRAEILTAVGRPRTLWNVHVDEDDGWWQGGDDILDQNVPMIMPANLTSTGGAFSLSCTLQQCLLEGSDGHSDRENSYDVHVEQDGSGFFSDVVSANYTVTCQAPEEGAQ